MFGQHRRSICLVGFRLGHGEESMDCYTDGAGRASVLE